MDYGDGGTIYPSFGRVELMSSLTLVLRDEVLVLECCHAFLLGMSHVPSPVQLSYGPPGAYTGGLWTSSFAQQCIGSVTIHAASTGSESC